MRQYFFGLLVPVLVIFKFGINPITFALFPTALVSYKLFVLDLLTKKLPNSLIYYSYLASLAIIIFFAIFKSNVRLFTYPILMSVLAFSFGLGIYILSQGRFGAGDVKLMMLCGLSLGLFSFEHLLIAGLISFLGLLITAITLLTLKKASTQTWIPFGPILLIATWIVILTLG